MGCPQPRGLVVISLLKMNVFKYVATFNLVDEYRSCGGICCLHLQVYSDLAYIQ
jgi:hypothetical protein